MTVRGRERHARRRRPAHPDQAGDDQGQGARQRVGLDDRHVLDCEAHPGGKRKQEAAGVPDHPPIGAPECHKTQSHAVEREADRQPPRDVVGGQVDADHCDGHRCDLERESLPQRSASRSQLSQQERDTGQRSHGVACGGRADPTTSANAITATAIDTSAGGVDLSAFDGRRTNRRDRQDHAHHEGDGEGGLGCHRQQNGQDADQAGDDGEREIAQVGSGQCDARGQRRQRGHEDAEEEVIVHQRQREGTGD